MTRNAQQLEMYAQVHLARLQLLSLRCQVETVASRIRENPVESRIGDVMTAVMLAGFTLELGLKIFHMTYGPSKPHGHDLKKLFDDLPQQIREDISATFAASSSRPLIKVYGFTLSDQEPTTMPGHQASRYDTAENVLLSSRNAFIKARYFFEEPTSGQWATIDDASHYMVTLSRVLEVVYDEYLKKQGWHAAHFSPTATPA